LFLQFWQPAEPWRFDDETAEPTAQELPSYSRNEVLHAWMPWLLLSLFVFLAGESHIKAWLNSMSAPEIQVPGLHERIRRDSPVVPELPSGQQHKPEPAIFTFGWLSATGSAIFVASILSAIWLRISIARFLRILGSTLYRVRWALFTIACMLALAFVTRYSGMDATLGLAFTKTGVFYPFFSPLLGWLGVALTGSDTSSNALFGSMQKITAESLVRDNVLPPEVTELQAVALLTTANSTGGVMGKMIDAQSIVVAAVATGQHNQEGTILRFVFWHSLALAVLMGILVMIQAYVWTSVIP
jgi:lactate permease